jgi:hypothetical protein
MTALTVPLNAIRPLVSNMFRVPGHPSFTAACFAGDHWSLGPLQKPEDVALYRAFADQVEQALSCIGAIRAFCPNPVPSNGEIVPCERLDRMLRLGRVTMYRSQPNPADGTFLSVPGDAGVFSAGGCGILVLVHGLTMIFAHASRESLIDRTWVETRGAEQARQKDMVDNALDALNIRRHQMSEVHAFLLYFIHPDEFVHRFDDKVHGEYNRAAAEILPQEFPGAAWKTDDGVHIDLPAVATLQLMRRGVLLQNINRDHQYLSNELPTTRKQGGRYLAAIVRN